MSNRKAPPAFEILTTADGSPTLSINGGEKMHSLEGALTESLYIYAPCMERAYSQGKGHILSMGLGLGYNEILSVGLALKNGVDPYFILSFEKVDFLRECFRNFLHESPTPLDSCYQWIFDSVAEHIQIEPKILFEQTRQALDNKKLLLLNELPLENPTSLLFNGILYDAFSGKTDKGLWEQEHLQSFLKNYSDQKFCLFSTYAATGNLKRALKEEGFSVEKKAGFGKKRESVFASRLP